MDTVSVKLVATEADLEAAIAVRFRVFVDEQSIPAEEELDADDAAATHAIAVENGQAIGAGRFVIRNGAAVIGRLAVDLPHRRRGIGAMLLRFLEAEAAAQGATEYMLHAQEYVKSFYAARGYAECGDVFLEVGIPHIEMRKGAR